MGCEWQLLSGMLACSCGGVPGFFLLKNMSMSISLFGLSAILFLIKFFLSIVAYSARLKICLRWISGHFYVIRIFAE
jgi:hypothetical protein